jgi:predicted transcriptional regulator
MKNYQQKAVESNQKKREIEPAPVSDYMVRVKDLITFKPETEIMNVVETLLKNRITGAPVLNDKNELVGLIDDKDCLKVLFDSSYHNQPVDNSTVAHFMSNVMRTISVHADIYDVADIFLTSIYKRLLVVDDDGRLAGQISRHDILRAINDSNTNAR